jgi:glycerol-3-phosphate acyltransferase PlsY
VIVSRAMGLAEPAQLRLEEPRRHQRAALGNKAAARSRWPSTPLEGHVPVVLALASRDRLGLSELAIRPRRPGGLHRPPVARVLPLPGGKGVATAAGVLLALTRTWAWPRWRAGSIVAFFFRYSSLASIVAAAFAPFYQLLRRAAARPLVCILPMSLLLVWRHGANIGKLLRRHREPHRPEGQGPCRPPDSPQRKAVDHGAEFDVGDPPVRDGGPATA